jgi:anti-anti-sigma regulatory factor
MSKVGVSLANSYGTDLSSRRIAALLRQSILKVLSANSRFTIDFVGVRTVSDSFADELFGALAADYGTEWLRDHLSLVGLSPEVRTIILSALQRGLKRTPSEHSVC